MSEAQRKYITESSIETRRCCPLPVRILETSAAEMDCAMVTAASLSGYTVRINRGRSLSEPACTVVRPEIA